VGLIAVVIMDLMVRMDKCPFGRWPSSMGTTGGAQHTSRKARTIARAGPNDWFDCDCMVRRGKRPAAGEIMSGRAEVIRACCLVQGLARKRRVGRGLISKWSLPDLR